MRSSFAVDGAVNLVKSITLIDFLSMLLVTDAFTFISDRQEQTLGENALRELDKGRANIGISHLIEFVENIGEAIGQGASTLRYYDIRSDNLLRKGTGCPGR
ncbi:MAG: hypothetical protein A4E62_01279 [Syntrophorhabdus sp. PtaU1.Bin002]|nr:MAG: hypothetical protein A4E62_01279 [Syntrophorhabdus sp. PtaU1.Bin002]